MAAFGSCVAADVVGLPRRKIGRLGSLSSGDDVLADDADALAEDEEIVAAVAPLAGGADDAVLSDGAAEVSEAGLFNVGRSGGPFGVCGWLLAVELSFPEGDDVDESSEGLFSVGRSDDPLALDEVLLADELPLPDDGDVLCGALALLDPELDDPLDPARCSTGRSSSGLYEGFGLGCLAACCATFSSSGSCGFQWPLPTQFPLTCSGVVTVKSPVGSP